MNAEIITVGDEILIGQIVDTNSAWLGEKLGDIGFRIMRITSVSDNQDEIATAVAQALERTPLVIITGGLGPTKDDITKHTLARLFHGNMILHEPTLSFVTQWLTRRGIDVNELNRAQALVPDCCRVLLNHNGTAPGMWFEQRGHVAISLPGVPYEMKAIMEEYGFQEIVRHFGVTPVVHETVMTFGIAESMLAALIEPWESALPRSAKLAYLPNPQGLKLRLSCYDGTLTHAQLKALFVEAESLIGDAWLGYMPTSLEASTARLLLDRKATLSVAESCTGGYLASKFTAMSGASEYFAGGIVSYANRVKIESLGVRAEDLERFGAVSQSVVEQMATGAREKFTTDYAIATSGVAGPTGGTVEKPIGTVWMAIATPQGVFSRRMQFGNLREQNIYRATANAIDMLRLHLMHT